MTRFRDDVVGLEATIIMDPQIWRASGHVETFVDMMRECPVTRKRVRADQVEPRSGTVVRFAGVFPRSKVEKKHFSAIEEFAPSLKNKELIESLFEKNITDAETLELVKEVIQNENVKDDPKKDYPSSSSYKKGDRLCRFQTSIS